MSKDEILKLARQAFETAKRAAAGGNPKYASLDVIPVVIGLDVLTVQLEGETVDDARGRAIRPECLIPLNIVGVEGVDKGLALMDVCPICLRGPTAGAEISSLPCKHAFHNHCVVHWLLKSRSCPLCRFEIVVNRRGVS
ncbi:E3 ubiquitin-protein ligase rnf181 [Phtheirospermum japonicum]|uniref:E3 ubiquitin-protein ligase rnf181 n=1 Tax=Phtheirospermum japonicum TaxID=374723 RepID=A0A830CVH1_9LAMI|nr:E3 ubiquitin-protein ligase rnf181 [Phtheirospermum japonicum]